MFWKSEFAGFGTFALVLLWEEVFWQTAFTKRTAKTTRNFSQEDLPPSSVSTHSLHRFAFLDVSKPSPLAQLPEPAHPKLPALAT